MATSSGADPPDGVSETNQEDPPVMDKRMEMLDNIEKAILEKVCPLANRSRPLC